MKTKHNKFKNSFRACGSEGFVPNTNYSRTTYNIDYYIGINGKVKTKFFGK
jgi:hypothetical protein